MMPIRISKMAIVFAIAVLYLIIFINNLLDYGSNLMFVEHVLKMDTVFPGNQCMWRSIQAPVWHHLFYGLIIFTEGAVSALCWVGGFRLVQSRRLPGNRFNREKVWATVGLLLGFILMVFGFMAVGGEWFFMWQSEKWSGGLNAALRLSVVNGLAAVILLQPDLDLGN